MIATQQQTRTKGERGYALLLVLFMVATLLLLGAVSTMNVITQGKREKETELAWRGNQYVRAIKLYYRKNGKWPTSIDDLTAYHTDQPRFIRKAYKDPMNNEDGSWRLIYLLPNGQLQNSVMHRTLQGVFGGAVPVNTASSPLGGPPQGGATGTGGTSGTSGQTPTTGGTGTGTGQVPQDASQNSTSDFNVNQSPIMGGNIIGVASKVKKPSIRVYEKGRTYFEWEFIYDPTANQGMPGQPVPQQPVPGQTQPGQVQPGQNPSGSGQNPTTPINPTTMQNPITPNPQIIHH